METILWHVGWERVLHSTAKMATISEKQQRPMPERNEIQWDIAELSEKSDIQLKICGDSLTTVGWVNAEFAVKANEHLSDIRLARQTLATMWANYDVLPVTAESEWLLHQYREYNKLADKLATKAVVESYKCWIVRPLPCNTKAI